MLRIWRRYCALCVIGNEFPCRQSHNTFATLYRGLTTFLQGQKPLALRRKNPAHLLFGEFNPNRSLGLARPNRRFGLKHVHHILFKIQIITLALVFYRSKIVKNTDLNFHEAHIVPQLLTMFLSKSGNSLTFNYHIIFYQKIHMVLVVDALTMKFYREIKFTHGKNILLLKSNLQCVLIHVFVEKRSHIIVNDLATPSYVITIIL